MHTQPTGERTRFQSERQREIADLVDDNGRVEVSDLARRFSVTTETIRRDLSELARHHVVRRVHGGAIAYERLRHEPMLVVRDTQNAQQKRKIARRAIEELPSAGSVIIDSGSTLSILADLFPDDRELTVFTNSIPVIQALSALQTVDVNVIGGLLRKNTMAMVDSTSVDAVRDLVVDILFISCDGVSPKHGFTTPYRQEVAIKRAMMSAARWVVMLFDHAKVGNDQVFRFAAIDEIDTIITDGAVPMATVRALQDLGPQVICVE